LDCVEIHPLQRAGTLEISPSADGEQGHRPCTPQTFLNKKFDQKTLLVVYAKPIIFHFQFSIIKPYGFSLYTETSSAA